MTFLYVLKTEFKHRFNCNIVVFSFVGTIVKEEPRPIITEKRIPVVRTLGPVQYGGL